MTTLTRHAATAKAIKEELKKAFPLVKFAVKSRAFAGGTAVDVQWENGPISKEVEAIAYKYQYGEFDCMYDIYEANNVRDDLPQVKYVQVRRNYSQGLVEQIFEDFKDYFANWEGLTEVHQSYKNDRGYFICPSEDIYRQLTKTDLTNGYKKELFWK